MIKNLIVFLSMASVMWLLFQVVTATLSSQWIIVGVLLMLAITVLIMIDHEA
jgi:hypothetical protein